MSDERIYPCNECGVMRTAAEGGTVFTCCTECWDKHYAASRVVAGGGLPTVLDLNLNDSLKADPVLVLLQTENDELKQRISSLEHTLSAIQRDAGVALEQRREAQARAEKFERLAAERYQECEEVRAHYGEPTLTYTAPITRLRAERDRALAQLAEARAEIERLSDRLRGIGYSFKDPK